MTCGDAIHPIGAVPPVRLHVDGGNAAAGVERHAGVQVLAARLGVGEEGLAAAGDPAHRPAEIPRREQGKDEFGISKVARAEPAAGIRHDDAQIVPADAQTAGDGGTHGVAGLATRAQREFAVAIVGQRAAWLHEGGSRAREGDILLDNSVRRCESRFGRGGIPRRPGQGPVVRRAVPQRCCILGQCILCRAQRGQGIVIDVDAFRRFQGRRLGLGDDEGDGLAGEAHPAVRQRILRRIGDRQQGFARRQRLAGAGRHCTHAGRSQVRRGVDRQNAPDGQRRRRIDGAEFGMGVRRAHDDRMSLAGQRQIGGEDAGAGQKGAILDARQ